MVLNWTECCHMALLVFLIFLSLLVYAEYYIGITPLSGRFLWDAIQKNSIRDKNDVLILASNLPEWYYPQEILRILVIGFLWIMVVWSYIASVLTKPGTVPVAFHRQTKGSVLSAIHLGGSLRVCARCHLYKPPRAHHCSHCKCCILKYDHHCPWIGQCVGFFNYKLYILLLFYGFLFCITVSMTFLWSLLRTAEISHPILTSDYAISDHTKINNLASAFSKKKNFPFSTSFLQNYPNFKRYLTSVTEFFMLRDPLTLDARWPVYVFLIVSMLFFILLFILLKKHIGYMLINSTTIQDVLWHSQQANGVYQISSQLQYDNGWERNLSEVFGDASRMQLFPLSKSCMSDRFSSLSECIALPIDFFVSDSEDTASNLLEKLNPRNHIFKSNIERLSKLDLLTRSPIHLYVNYPNRFEHKSFSILPNSSKKNFESLVVQCTPENSSSINIADENPSHNNNVDQAPCGSFYELRYCRRSNMLRWFLRFIPIPPFPNQRYLHGYWLDSLDKSALNMLWWQPLSDELDFFMNKQFSSVEIEPLKYLSTPFLLDSYGSVNNVSPDSKDRNGFPFSTLTSRAYSMLVPLLNDIYKTLIEIDQKKTNLPPVPYESQNEIINAERQWLPSFLLGLSFNLKTTYIKEKDAFFSSDEQEYLVNPASSLARASLSSLELSQNNLMV